MLRLAAVCAAVSLCALAAVPAPPGPPAGYPPPKTLGPVETYGANIQRAMTLLATSTALKRNTIRILFYGQSITADDWWKDVAEDLRRRFPVTDLVIENRAVIGFHAELLAKTAEADLYPFYPDLVIFHDYGSPEQYEVIIRRIRERNTADILHATDHLCTYFNDDPDESTDPLKTPRPDFAKTGDTPEVRRWASHVFLPTISKRYGTELADVRGLWKRYLKDHKLAVRDLLSDTIHLNDRGNYLMAEIIKAHLRHRPELSDDAWKDWVITYAVGTDVHWKDGKLVLPFDGNRVDLVCDEVGESAPPAAVRIDGKKPSAFPELYAATRAELVAPRGSLPPVLRVQAEKPRVVEEWTLKATATGPERKQFRFRVSGSVTGEDGEGEIGKRFMSRSGRVVIDAGDWYHENALLATNQPAATDFEVRWRVVPLFADEFVMPERKNPFGDTVVTVAQGLPNGKHTLEVTGGPDTPITAVRVYRPPLSVR